MNENPNSKLKIIPLGGMEQIGMNITAFEYEDSIIVVDCGLAFPENDMLGIDLVVPDTTYLKENIDKVKCFFITHGHVHNKENLPMLKKGDLLIHGHTHIQAMENCGDYIYINPGSVSIPKAGNQHSYMMYEDGTFSIRNLEGQEIMKYTL